MEFSKESGAAQLGGYFGSSRLDCSADLIKATASIRSCKSRFKCCYSVAVYLEPQSVKRLARSNIVLLDEYATPDEVGVSMQYIFLAYEVCFPIHTMNKRQG
jgi:hypothetical protein